MVEMSRRRQGELVRGTFEILLGHPEGLRARDVLASLEKRLPPTPFESEDYPSTPGVRRFEKMVRFATIPAVKAGWLLKNKGSWILTAEGRDAFERLPDPEDFMNESVRLYRQWEKARPDAEEEGDEAQTHTQEDEAALTLEEAEEFAWAAIEGHLGSLNPYEFQDLVAGLLQGMGYHVSWVAPAGPDRGIDVIAHADPLGVVGPRIKVQVKHRSGATPVGDIRSFLAMLSENDVGLFVSTGGYTKDAEQEARYQERRRLMLVDLRRLFDLWVEHYDKIPETARRLLLLKKVHFLAPRTR